MRIALIGQAAFGETVLKRLREAGFDVVGVAAPAPKEGQRPDPLWAAAEAAGLPLLETRRLRRPEVFEKYEALKPDLNVMAFVTDIIRTNVLTAPPLGTIQYHPSLLPRHRGISSINWAVAQGDAKTGLTIFWVDEGIDTGPVLLQKEVEIGPDDTVGSLYFNRLFPLGVDAMVEAVGMVQAGNAPHLVQDESQATYEAPFSDEHARIDWQAPAAVTFNLMRASDPQPGAVTSYGGETLKLFDPQRVSESVSGAPGTIAAIDDAGLLIATSGGGVRVKRVSAGTGAKIPAARWAQEAGAHIGQRLGD